MAEPDPVIAAIAAAVRAQPDVVDLRVHLVELLVERGRAAEALEHCGAGLALAPGDPRLVGLLRRCTDALAGVQNPPATEAPPVADGFDWSAAEDQIDGSEFVEAFASASPVPIAEDDVDGLETVGVRLADVGGMNDVKRQLDLTLFAPLRNPALAQAFRTSARGGLLLYGPPGCGKSFLATAVAGELGAKFYRVGISDVLHSHLGESEEALAAIFATARRNAPCVLFFDELDALGHRRGALRGDGLRTVVNQLLVEMDSGTTANDGVYILGATNHPWDVDVALRRPGRFDRMILVTPPDLDARVSILTYHLRDRPVVGVDLIDLARRTDGLTGADLMHVCNLATQYAMSASLASGRVEPVTMREVGSALSQVRSSAGAWFDTARSVLQFANSDGSFDELAKFMRGRR
ncbi:cell division control protein 48 CDC48 [Gordonia spumicola]|uniref:Cell division control protein 48 CDC48 n=1 Tax=Gordonia spumicola TaxID=589161 RepID=A0A7I9V7Y9_9ACTN|nr:ATP-binding protein [Gordonia spumicola]GEE01495.1 cell division control protein 48 CDC48 [Gordonia spumicola]